MKYTITAYTQNSPGVLYRIADLFLKRKINIEKLTVHETGKKGISKFIIQSDIPDTVIHTLTKQIERIIEVMKVG